VPNPVINQFGRSAGGGVPSAGDLQGMFDKPAYTGPRPTDRYMTLDDVVQRTAAMLGTILVAGAIAWVAVPDRLFTPVRSFAERGSGGLEFLELPESHRLIEIDVPAALEGLTVAEAAPRARFGISVLAVNRMGRDGIERRFVPGPADRFEHGDVLVVLGTDEAIAKLQEARSAPVTAG